MKAIRRFPSWLPRQLESLVFSLFALIWTASLSGCQERVAVSPTQPVAQDSVAAKYGVITPPKDSVAVKYGVITPSKDSVAAKYGVITPPKDTVVKDTSIEIIKPLYGVIDRPRAWYGTTTPIQLDSVKYIPIDSIKAPATGDSTKVSLGGLDSESSGEGKGEA